MPGVIQRINGFKRPCDKGFDGEAEKKTKTVGYNPFTSALLRCWLSGDVSAAALQELAYNHSLVAKADPEVVKLASMGTWGRHPNKINKQLCEYMESLPGHMPKATAKKVPCKDTKTGATIEAATEFFEPENLVSELYHKDEKHFHHKYGTKHLEAFWDGVKDDDPKLRMLLAETGWSRSDLKKVIPLWIHGDKAEFTESDSNMFLSMGPVLNQETTFPSTDLLANYPSACVLPATWTSIWASLAPSFTQMVYGIDKKGDSLAGGFKFCIWNILGDHDNHSNYFGMPHWNKEEFCWECLGTKATGALCFKHGMPVAPCRSFDDEKSNRLSKHPIFTIPGVSRFNICQDAMHIVYCNGILAHAMGNFLKKQCWKDDASRQTVAPKVRVDLLFQRIQQLYKETNSDNRLSNLTLNMFLDPGKPHQSKPYLKMKAGECRELVPVFKQLAHDLNTGTVYDNKMCHLFDSIAAFDELVSRCSLFPTATQAEQAIQHMDEFLKANDWLHENEENDNMWHIVFKHHMAGHLAQAFRFMNPRCYWCFKAEDFVGKLAKLAHSCTYGTKNVQVAAKIIKKYTYLMNFLRFREGA